MISILLPTRGRQRDLKQNLGLLHKFAADRSTYEVLIRCDRDDEETQRLLPELDYDLALVGEHRGYKGLHTYLNEMSAVARGEWLMLYGDDLRMQTQEWDRVLRAGLEGWFCFASHGTPYPILHRDAYELMGQFAGVRAADTYLQWIFSTAKRPGKRLGLEIKNAVCCGGGLTEGEREIMQRDALHWGAVIREVLDAA